MVAANPKRSRALGTAFVLFFVSLFLIAYSSRNPAAARIGTAVLSEILAPLQSAVNGGRRWVAEWLAAGRSLLDLRAENERIGSQLAVLLEEKSRLMELEHENRRLRELLGLQQATALAGVVANVISYDPSNWSQVLTIDRGRANGVRTEMAVVAGSGVVGSVIAASLRSARVLLLTDHSSGIDAVIQDSRVRGVVVGGGGFNAYWSFVAAEETIRIGDRIVTSGMDGIFPKGLMVGVVAQIKSEGRGALFQDVIVAPAVDLSRLETVFVITDEEFGRSVGGPYE